MHSLGLYTVDSFSMTPPLSTQSSTEELPTVTENLHAKRTDYAIRLHIAAGHLDVHVLARNAVNAVSNIIVARAWQVLRY